MEDLNKKGHTVESWTYLNDKLISHDVKTMSLKWMSEKELLGTENISIGFINSDYIEVNEIQDKDDEYK